MGMKICLDAGHYGKYNRSPADKSYYESDEKKKFNSGIYTIVEGEESV